MNELDISVVILTYNEEIHIRRCIENLLSTVKHIFVVDSFSNDATLSIAKEYDKVTVLQNKWENNHAKQFNWGLEHADIRTKWVLRLDADEYLTEDLKHELSERLPLLPQDVTGVVFPLRRVFLGRTMKRGGMKQIKLLRLFQYGKAKSEIRLMDEHIQLTEGRAIEFSGEFADDNLNNISWWTQKHVGYAIREAIDMLDIEYDLTGVAIDDANKNLSEQALAKRKLKHKYVNQPMFWRAFFYFCYRYFLKLGFLDGKEGFLWHFLQGWWYRTLVDAKIYEVKKACGGDKNKMLHFIGKEFKINLIKE